MVKTKDIFKAFVLTRYMRALCFPGLTDRDNRSWPIND